ncbi:YbaB/EbfC family nucleoid-associated protein [Magnetofaba australis]
MLKQAQMMQAKMAKVQEELAVTTVEGQAGAGLVTVVMNGKNLLEKVTIDPKLADPEDMEMLEDLVTAAVNDAQARMQQISQDKLSAVTGGLNIPGMKMPF